MPASRNAAPERIAYSVPEVAALLGVVRSTVYELMTREEDPLPSFKAGGRRLVSAAALAEFVSRADPFEPARNRRPSAAGAR